uniref:Uncharacterized protein n=1 Tax=Oryza glumipatula TaxID=40148 RepID=A0A0D9Y3Z6_9ORYZ
MESHEEEPRAISLEVILEQAGKSFDMTYMHLRETRQSDENKRVYVPGKSSNVKGVMARLVSTALMRGLVRSSRAPRVAAVSQPAIQQFRNYSSGLGGDSSAKGDSSSTRVAADPDTHQDFQPTSKSSNMSFDDIVARDIKENPVLIYMKGFPESPMCGFSALAIKVLKLYDVPISARDILGDLKLKECVKAHTRVSLRMCLAILHKSMSKKNHHEDNNKYAVFVT